MHDRWCVLATPRTGSQWCMRVLRENLLAARPERPVRNLIEFFEPYADFFGQFYLDKDGYIRHDAEIKFDQFRDKHNTHRHSRYLHPDYRARLDMLAQANPQQGQLVKLFVRPYRYRNLELEVCQYLGNIGYRFIGLTRNFTDTVLSNIMADTATQDYNNNIWPIGSRLEAKKYYVNAEKLNLNMKCALQFMINLRWTAYMDSLVGAGNWHPVRYEYMLADLGQALGHQLQDMKDPVKTLERDPYEYMENADEIRSIIESWNKRLTDFLEK